MTKSNIIKQTDHEVVSYLGQAITKAIKRRDEIRKIKEDAETKLIAAKAARGLLFDELFKVLQEFDRQPFESGEFLEILGTRPSFTCNVNTVDKFGTKKVLFEIEISPDKEILIKNGGWKGKIIRFVKVDEFMGYFVDQVANYLKV